jgi:hypothetical protein
MDFTADGFFRGGTHDTYRVLTIGHDGRFTGPPTIIECDHDRDILAYAEKLANGHAILIPKPILRIIPCAIESAAHCGEGSEAAELAGPPALPKICAAWEEPKEGICIISPKIDLEHWEPHDGR